MSHGVRLFLIIGLSQRKSRCINLKKDPNSCLYCQTPVKLDFQSHLHEMNVISSDKYPLKKFRSFECLGKGLSATETKLKIVDKSR